MAFIGINEWLYDEVLNKILFSPLRAPRGSTTPCERTVWAIFATVRPQDITQHVQFSSQETSE